MLASEFKIEEGMVYASALTGKRLHKGRAAEIGGIDPLYDTRDSYGQPKLGTSACGQVVKFWGSKLGNMDAMYLCRFCFKR